MSLKFAANLNFLFTESSEKLAEKMLLAHNAGFRAVEIPFVRSEQEDVIKVKENTGIEVALINIALEESDDFKFGAASIPCAEETFRKHLIETVQFAKSLNCKKIHLMAGIMRGDYAEHLKTYINNIKYAVAYLEKENLTGVIEPINKYSLPSYFMNSYETASSVIKEINSEHLKLMLDVFHLQHIRGNITRAFGDMHDIIGHIQIAQVPNRNEPDTNGELDFSYIFSMIEKSGYNDWIGCEYKPQTATLDSLKWISKFGYNL